MKTRHKTAVIVVGITFLGATQVLTAQPAWGGGRGRGGGPPAAARFDADRPFGGPMGQRWGGPGPMSMPGGLGRLDLTEEQRAKIREILTEEQLEQLGQIKPWAGQSRGQMRDIRTPGGRRNWQGGRRGRQWQNCPWMQGRGRRGAASFGNRSRRGGWGPARARRPQGPAPMMRGQFFDRADKDNDGKLTREEIDAFRGQARPFQPRNRAFGPQDAPGGRGPVPPAGREGRRPQMRQGRPDGAGEPSADRPRGGGRGPGAFQPRNRAAGPQDAPGGRGPVPPAGREGRRPQMRQGRPDGPGEPSADRPRSGGRGPGAGAPAQQRGPFMLKRVFEQADTNEDGLLSMAEVEAFQNKMQDRPGSQGR